MRHRGTSFTSGTFTSESMPKRHHGTSFTSDAFTSKCSTCSATDGKGFATTCRRCQALRWQGHSWQESKQCLLTGQHWHVGLLRSMRRRDRLWREEDETFKSRQLFLPFLVITGGRTRRRGKWTAGAPA